MQYSFCDVIDYFPYFFLPFSHFSSSEFDCLQDLEKAKRAPGSSTLPMICFREGSPPLPDVNNISRTGLGKFL